MIGETSCRKWGHTPGVRRQYPGCVGKVENGIVTVYLGVAEGTFPARLDADPFLPQSWPEGRTRCRAAGIPDDVRHRPKWRPAVGQWMRASEGGVSFDWLTSDEGCGAVIPFLRFLNLANQRFVAEVPVNVTVREVDGGPARRAPGRVRRAPGAGRGTGWPTGRSRASYWRAVAATVWVAGREHTLVAAADERTGEAKYFPTNATTTAPGRVMAVAFRRWAVEHAFRLGKQEAGRMGYEGRNYTGLLRPLTLVLIVLGFVTTHTERLPGEKPGGDGRASARALNHRCGVVFRRRRGVPAVRHTCAVVRYHQRRNAQAAKSHNKEQRHKCVP